MNDLKQYRSYKELSKSEKETVEKCFKEETKSIYDYILAVGFIPLIAFLLFFRSFWYVGLVLTIITFVALQLFVDQKYACYLLTTRKIRGFREFLIKKEISSIGENQQDRDE